MRKNLVSILSFFLLTALTACGGTTSGSSASGTTSAGGTAPQIVVKMVSSQIFAGGGPYQFGTVVADGTQFSSIAFTIENQGTADLTTSDISITGDATYFSLSGGSASTIAAGGSNTFTIKFTPDTSKTAFSALVTIPNNDTSVNDVFQFSIAGNGTTTSPQISVHDNEYSQNILSGSGAKNFGSLAVGGTKSVTFTVLNTGTAPLYIGAVASMTEFSTTAITASPIAAGSSETFTVTFAPVGTAGYRSQTITVPWGADASATNSFTFTVSGTGTAAAAPNINVKQGSSNLASGTGNYTVANTIVLGTTSPVFTIQNIGSSLLTLGAITSSDPQFTISGAPASVAASSTGTFTVAFKPTAAGVQTTTLTIPSNDADTLSYTITLTGTGIDAKPLIVPGVYDFGSITRSSSSAAMTFTIQNTGTAAMSVPNATSVASSLPNFAIASQPAFPATIAPGESTYFTAIFTPTSNGVQNPVFTFTYSNGVTSGLSVTTTNIKGTGVGVPSIAVDRTAPTALSISAGGSDAFGATTVSTPVSHTFQITNSGTANLSIPSLAIIGGSSAFSINTVALSNPVLNGTPQTFTVTYNPLVVSTNDTATITISNNSGTNPFVFTVTGTGTGTPAISVSGTTAFGNVNTSTPSSAHVFNINNTGNGIMTVTSIAMNTGSTADFAITAPATPFTIAAGSSVSLSVVFTPGAVGARRQ